MNKNSFSAGFRGFSLMELLLVVALISIVAAVGMPTVYHNFVRESDSYMVDSLIVEIEYARSMGLMDLPAYATFKTIADTPNFECATQSKRLDGNVTFADSDFFQFDSRGMLIDVYGAPMAQRFITIRSAGEAKGTVIVTPAGLVKRQ